MNDKNYSVARVEQHTKASIGKCRGIGRDLIEDHVRAIREREAYENQQRKQAHRRHEIRAR